MEARQLGEIQIFLTRVYGPPKLSKRGRLWDFMKPSNINMSHLWLLAGDFN